MGLINMLWCLHFPFQFLSSASCLLLSIRAAGFKVILKGTYSKFSAHKVLNPLLAPYMWPSWFSAVRLVHLILTRPILEKWGQWVLQLIIEPQWFPERTCLNEFLLELKTTGNPSQGPLEGKGVVNTPAFRSFWTLLACVCMCVLGRGRRRRHVGEYIREKCCLYACRFVTCLLFCDVLPCWFCICISYLIIQSTSSSKAKGDLSLPALCWPHHSKLT
jgi:hypothetical protein